jgi:hypothetical protein
MVLKRGGDEARAGWQELNLRKFAALQQIERGNRARVIHDPEGRPNRHID